jgi:hypothetical protein
MADGVGAIQIRGLAVTQAAFDRLQERVLSKLKALAEQHDPSLAIAFDLLLELGDTADALDTERTLVGVLKAETTDLRTALDCAIRDQAEAPKGEWSAQYGQLTWSINGEPVLPHGTGFPRGVWPTEELKAYRQSPVIEIDPIESKVDVRESIVSEIQAPVETGQSQAETAETKGSAQNPNETEVSAARQTIEQKVLALWDQGMRVGLITSSLAGRCKAARIREILIAAGHDPASRDVRPARHVVTRQDKIDAVERAFARKDVTDEDLREAAEQPVTRQPVSDCTFLESLIERLYPDAEARKRAIAAGRGVMVHGLPIDHLIGVLHLAGLAKRPAEMPGYIPAELSDIQRAYSLCGQQIEALQGMRTHTARAVA